MLRRGVKSIDKMIWQKNFLESEKKIWEDEVKYGIKVGIQKK